MAQKDDHERTPLHIATSAGNTVFAYILIKHGAEPQATDEEGMNAVHHFATSARIEERLAKDDTLVFMIMDNMEDCIDQKDMYERTPLMSAISKGNGNIALLLLSRGADPKVADSSGKTPFVVACRDGNCTKFVDEVLCTQNEAYVNMGDSIDDMSALSWACLCGETDIVKRLLKAESVDLNRRANTSKGYTPLYLALLSESSEIMSILLDDDRIDLDGSSVDSDGLTLLEFAAKRSNEECLRVLLLHPKAKDKRLLESALVTPDLEDVIG